MQSGPVPARPYSPPVQPYPPPVQPYPPPVRPSPGSIEYPPPYLPDYGRQPPLAPYADPAGPAQRTARLSHPVPGPQPPSPAEAPLELCEGAQKIGQVGPLPILACEVSGQVDQVLEKNKDRIPEHQIEMQRKLLTKQLLKNLIETKLIYNDARQTIPEENFPGIEKSLSEQFEKAELKSMMKRAKVETRRHLEAKLRQMGTSLRREKRAFSERTLAQQWMSQQIKRDEEVSIDQMWAYYNEHVADYQKPGRARWQQLTARFSKRPSKQAAYAAIARMGNRTIANVPMDQVAKAESDGATASDGGWRDWTVQDSLVSEVLDRAIFELPVGRLSPILEDQTGYHIIRIVEREQASQTPFIEAQKEIAPKISQRRVREQMQAYLAKLRKNTPVWTIFDEPDDERVTTRPDRQ